MDEFSGLSASRDQYDEFGALQNFIKEDHKSFVTNFLLKTSK